MKTNNPTPTAPRILTVKAAAAYLGVSERTLYNFYYAGTIPFIKMSQRSVRVDLADLDAFINSRKEGAK